LLPVANQFHGKHITDIEAALVWCRQFVVSLADREARIVARGR
jgi:hypothetical protein